MTQWTPEGTDKQSTSSETSETDTANIPTPEKRQVQHKKDQIMLAVEEGNYPKARRHAVELVQLLGIDDNELPIESGLDELE